jgi:hypothetical protein
MQSNGAIQTGELATADLRTVQLPSLRGKHASLWLVGVPVSVLLLLGLVLGLFNVFAWIHLIAVLVNS